MPGSEFQFYIVRLKALASTCMMYLLMNVSILYSSIKRRGGEANTQGDSGFQFYIVRLKEKWFASLPKWLQVSILYSSIKSQKTYFELQKKDCFNSI